MSETATASDGLENVISGLGTGRTKRASNRFVIHNLMEYEQLEAAYLTDWLAEMIVDMPAEDSLRPWRTIKSPGAETIALEEGRLRVPELVLQARKWARLYGGAGIIMLTGQPLEEPLNLNKIKRGSLQRCIAFDRFDLSPLSINTWNALAENYLRPEIFTVRGGSQRIHWSHVARFPGATLPKRYAAQVHGWGDSALRRPVDRIADLVASIDGIAELMQEANVDVITRTGLNDELASQEEDLILRRYRLFSMAKSVVNLALLDADETYDRKTLNLTGVAPSIEQFMVLIAAAARIPYAKLFGTSAKGMNATGEGDENSYYDQLASERVHKIEPGLATIDDVMVRSALGAYPEEFDWSWNPFKQLSDKEESEVRKSRAETHRIYLEDEVITVAQVRRELQTREEYQFTEEQLQGDDLIDLGGEADADEIEPEAGHEAGQEGGGSIPPRAEPAIE